MFWQYSLRSSGLVTTVKQSGVFYISMVSDPRELKTNLGRLGPNLDRGFTLLEILIVAVTAALLIGALLQFFGGQAQRNQAIRRAAAAFAADIRQSQSLALSSSRFLAESLCGYGIHYVDERTYLIYKGFSEGTTCPNSNHNFQSGTDGIAKTAAVVEPKVRFAAPFADIFFEPPNPAVYINNDSRMGQPPLEVKFCFLTTPDCKSLFIYPGGRVDTP